MSGDRVRPLHRLFRDLRRDERGIAVPTALMALIATFAISSVAVMSTVDVQQGTERDHNSKEAIAAADAGANIALLRLNRYLPSLTDRPSLRRRPRRIPDRRSAAGARRPRPKRSAAPPTATRSAPTPARGTVNVVSVGASGTVQRRVNVALTTSTGKNVFADEKFIGQDEITVKGNFKIEADIGTNGNIIQNGGSGTICGDDRHGIGKDGADAELLAE